MNLGASRKIKKENKGSQSGWDTSNWVSQQAILVPIKGSKVDPSVLSYLVTQTIIHRTVPQNDYRAFFVLIFLFVKNYNISLYSF